MCAYEATEMCCYVIGDISLPSLDDSDLESEASQASTHSQQLHRAFRLVHNAYTYTRHIYIIYVREIVCQLDGKDDITFSSFLPQPCSRKTAAKRFSQLLGTALIITHVLLIQVLFTSYDI